MKEPGTYEMTLEVQVLLNEPNDEHMLVNMPPFAVKVEKPAETK